MYHTVKFADDLKHIAENLFLKKQLQQKEEENKNIKEAFNNNNKRRSKMSYMLQ